MTSENPHIPDWARRARQADLDWIAGNLDVLWLVDTTVQPPPDAGNPFACGAFDQIEPYADEDTQRRLAEYDPARELVLVLLKTDNRTGTYRVQIIPPEESDEGLTRWRTFDQARDSESEPKLGIPDIETLVEWEAEGSCEAACPHHGWVEPDGVCPHGNPSWLL